MALFLATTRKAAFVAENVGLVLFNLTNFAYDFLDGAFLVWIYTWEHQSHSYILNLVLFLHLKANPLFIIFTLLPVSVI